MPTTPPSGPALSRGLLALAVAALLPIGGCGGSSAASGGASAAPPVPTTPAPTPSPEPADRVAPSAPTGLTATSVSATQVRLAWNAANANVGVVSYRVFRDGLPVGSVSSTSYTATGLMPMTRYSFSVQAMDAAQNLSAQSTPIEVMTPTASGNVLKANPSNYASIVSALKPGDTLILEPGTYNDPSMPGLRLRGLNGTAAAPIVIMGDPARPRPVLQGRGDVNTVRFGNSSYIVLRHLEIDSLNLGGDGVNTDAVAHDITLEDLVIKGVGPDQSTVGIATHGGPTWNWIIRRCVIDGAGTGMYLGSSTGGMPFINGRIENNLIINSIGYNIEIKHQLASLYPTLPGMPTGPNVTYIRNNVFHKSGNSSTGAMARPNLLVGSFPLSGPGSQDRYEIYGNFFYQNGTEALFQGEGNIAFHHNLMVNTLGDALNIQRHNGEVRTVDIFHNTIVASSSGIRVSGGAPGFAQRVIGNAVFASSPISGGAQRDNVTGSYTNAATHLVNPTGPIGQLDLYPRAGALQGSPIDRTLLQTYAEWNRDFNRVSHPDTQRGAYAGSGANPGWRPRLEIQP